MTGRFGPPDDPYAAGWERGYLNALSDFRQLAADADTLLVAIGDCDQCGDEWPRLCETHDGDMCAWWEHRDQIMRS